MIGSIIPFTGSVIPDGHLVCDGSAVSRSEYSDLFEVIGTNFGEGDGSTTFNLPNIGDRVIIGDSLAHGFATTGGEEEHVLNVGEIAEHDHEIPAHGHANDIAFKTPSLSHSITTQPSFTYTRLNGTFNGTPQAGSAYNGRTNSSMSRATAVAITAHAATACTMAGGITDCAAMTSGDAGSGDAHNNMMPYIALVYLIQAEPDQPPGPVIPSMVLFNGAMPVGPSGAYIAGRR